MIPESHRFEATQELRQVLNRAVDWGLLESNPAKRGTRNTPRRAREKRPFESWQQIEAVAAELSPVCGPMVVLAAATGLRPSELFGLEWRDVDREAGVVYVRRAYANGRLKHTKTRLSNRAVPLQAKAFDALDGLPRSDNRFMGSSIAMIDHHYGHLAYDSRQHAVSLLNALALERAVDAAWTSQPKRAKPLHDRQSRPRTKRALRAVDARWTSRLATVVTLDDKRS